MNIAVPLLTRSLALSLGCASALAQDFSLDWFKIAGGGGTSTGGVFSVRGTIGQSDAGGAMTNGPFSLTGGFWVLPIAVPTENAPTLLIAPGPAGFATISWATTPGFVLQSTPSLTMPAWTNAPSGSTNPVVVPATVPAQFYRLIKP